MRKEGYRSYFCFQAEDGIRDLVRSRGLGDVYKRQDVINAYRAIETKMQPQLKKLFNLVPKAKFEVRQTEAFREVSASAEYNLSLIHI